LHYLAGRKSISLFMISAIYKFSAPFLKAALLNFSQNINQELGFPQKKSTELVEQLIETIKSTLASGEDFLISGFGKFCVNEKREQRGRNPTTGEAMMLASRKVVSFRCSGKLRKKVNGI
jgi:integration host factor subunit alpha